MSKKLALISVYDKSGIIEFAKKISESYDIVASGGTAKTLTQAGIAVSQIENYTSSPEILGGRVKTLHPKIFGGILAKSVEVHQKELRENGIRCIDLVVCNLYPFEETVASGTEEEEIIEKIDIGGPTLLRAAAKNFERVGVICDISDYNEEIEKLESLEYRRKLAAKAFHHVTKYDLEIAKYFGNSEGIIERKSLKLRYGENPHQQASVYGELFFEQISGKEVSFNNILDVKEGLKLVHEFSKPACAIIKHRTPCGVGLADDPHTAYSRALIGDKMSAFGGVFCFNCEIDEKTARLLTSMFVDVLIAKSYTTEAVELLAKKRTVLLQSTRADFKKRDLFEIPGGFIIQDSDVHTLSKQDYKVVSKKTASQSLINDLLFAWIVAKHSRSNAIVICKGNTVLGIGSGQTSRVDAAKQAIAKAEESVRGAVLASDAFFPFRDTVDIAAKAGIEAIIVPSGSIRDHESIEAADELGIILVHTKYRAFKH